MSSPRSIQKIAKAFETVEGGGVLIDRALPSREIPLDLVDPFLLLDEARIDASGPGFPEHPHRGFEILTYILEGWGSHKDNLGNEGRIEAGGVMHLCAGSGIRHGESAGGKAAGVAHGIQFWVNLPLAEKKRPPSFKILHPEEVPVEAVEGASTRVLVGPGSPLSMVTPMTYLDVTLQPGAAWSRDLDPAWQGYCYVLEGQGKFGAQGAQGSDTDLLVLGPGDALAVRNDSDSALRFLLAAGQPLRQPIRWNGPFVD